MKPTTGGSYTYDRETGTYTQITPPTGERDCACRPDVPDVTPDDPVAPDIQTEPESEPEKPKRRKR